MRTKRTIALVAAIATLSLTLVGCSGTGTPYSSDASSQGSEAPTESSPDAESPSASAAPERGADLATTVFAVTWKDAIDIAKSSFDGELLEIELEWNRSGFVYEIELVAATEEFEVRVDATTGETSNERTEAISADEFTRKQPEVINLDAVVSWDEALAAALGAQSGTVDEWKLEGTRSGPQFIFEVIDSSGRDFEVTVDAVTGKLISVDD